jgi:hypothetical protein
VHSGDAATVRCTAQIDNGETARLVSVCFPSERARVLTDMKNFPEVRKAFRTEACATRAWLGHTAWRGP